MTATVSNPLDASLPAVPPSSSGHMSLREQAAVVRTLLDEVERLAPSSGGPASEQLVEELARLGRRVLEVAATMEIDAMTSLSGAA